MANALGKHLNLIITRETNTISEICNFFDSAEHSFHQTSFKGDFIQKCHKFFYDSIIIIGYSTNELTDFFDSYKKWLSPQTNLIISTNAQLKTVSKATKLKRFNSIQYPLNMFELKSVINEKMCMRKRILIVDDSEINREFLKECFNGLNCKIYEAEDGKEAFEVIHNIQIDLVLLDFMLPDINGDKILEEIRSNFDATKLPVIIVSAQDDMSNVKNLLALGMNDYIVKPIDLKTLLSKVQVYFDLDSLKVAS
ncbi:MAG: hypothetical protein BM556_15490 [Bacteriovorax sp. MedPE-SWde]|nr:MAG: hypothetical protein BM556_15490 [Bacteriovorax sp. MedPE-SWde]